MKKLLVPIGTAMALAVSAPISAEAGTETCAVDDTSTKEVVSGVTLTWDSSFRCSNAPDEGRYAITVEVANDDDSDHSVVIDRLRLAKTTPRPRGAKPDATATANGLPLRIAPGDSETFDVGGRYELVSTDEGDKANLHLRAGGAADGERFRLGINVHLRG